ncbi:MAG: DUF1929 domain-containing protein [Thaumarchaeota archaeon]|nr:DUF1929 domain-containing protein [Nitrososphaerota archaeon]
METEYSTKGQWEPIKYKFNHIPVHIALLHTNKVLAFGGTGNDEMNKKPYPAEVFDPQTGQIQLIQQDLDGDVFCAGHAFLPDGKLFVAGGTYKYDLELFGLPIRPFSGLEQSYIFDPHQMKWVKKGSMNFGRWYPTCIMIPDGRVVCIGGLTKSFPRVFLNKLETYSESEGWKKLSSTNFLLDLILQVLKNSPGQKLDRADRWLPLYPRFHLLPSGEIFYAGSYNTHITFPFLLAYFPSATFNIDTSTWTVIGNPNNQNREEGTTVLLPFTPNDHTARVLLIGGGTLTGADATNAVEMIDFSEEKPQWKSIDPMAHKRYYSYPVILPDQQVLVLGGRKGKAIHTMSNTDSMHSGDGEVPHDPNAILEPELFNPKTGKWSKMAPMHVDRVYHSNAILLLDGRVMTAGSNPMRRTNELRIEFYNPPYMFKGQRPKIEDAPDKVSYGNKFEIKTADAGDIEAVALIHPSTTTHCVNTEQRYVGLSFDNSSNKITAKIPTNHNLAPPGFYMLFIIKHEGIPSKGKFIHLS